MMENKWLTLLACVLAVLFSVHTMSGQTQLIVPDLSVPTKVSPGYFGPNAFPVPDMLDGRTSPVLKLEMYSDNSFGTMAGALDDFTSSLFLRLSIPLFTPRVNLVVYGPIMEYYSVSEKVGRLRRIVWRGDKPLRKAIAGDVYVSTDIMLLIQDRHNVDMTVRAALKSASGGYFEQARFYDCPGYFFDASFGRDFCLGDENVIRASLSSGFLCWQTADGRQNDAVMYGVQAAYRSGPFNVSADFGGYAGWENDGDRPMTIKARASWAFSPVTLVAGYQYGFVDWPFHQIRLGLALTFGKFQYSRKFPACP